MHGVDIGRMGIAMDRVYVDVARDSGKMVTAYQLIALCGRIYSQLSMRFNRSPAV